MRKFIYLLLIPLLILGCTQENTVVVETNPADLDGDGVTNQQETIDNTNPEDGCDYLQSSQFYPDTSSEWRARDCDGDGVTNGDEIDPDGNGGNEDNGTDPQDRCDFELSRQTLPPFQFWLNADCDEDGVSNGQELNDGTNPSDPCSLLLANQTSQPQAWLALDCDGDCVRNELEVEDGTDPFDEGDYLGNGTTLYQFITRSSRVVAIDENGSRYAQVTEPNGTVLNTYSYANNNLTAAQVETSSGVTNFAFEYQNDLLSTVTKTEGGVTGTYDLEYDGNTIIADGDFAAPGQYYIKLTFDATGQFLLTREKFLQSGSQWKQYHQTFEYNNTGNQISQITKKARNYYPSTGTFGNFEVEREVTHYSFYSETKNPLKEASDKIKLAIYFEPSLLSNITTLRSNEYTLFEPFFQESYSYFYDILGYTLTNEVCNSNAQNYLTRGARLSEYGGVIFDIIFLYE